MLDYLLHRPSAHALVLHANKTRGFGTSGTEMGPQELCQAGPVDRHAAHRFPWQISSLKESRQEGGEWLILTVSRGQWLHYHPTLGPSIVVQVHLISRREIYDTSAYPLLLSPHSSSLPENMVSPQRSKRGGFQSIREHAGHLLRCWTSLVQAIPHCLCSAALKGSSCGSSPCTGPYMPHQAGKYVFSDS